MSVKNTRIVEDAQNETQNEITVRIVDQKVDYVLGLKGNQGWLHETDRITLSRTKPPISIRKKV
jgi:hypothetical protein